MHSKTRLFIALLPILPIVLLSTSAQAFNPEQLKQLLKTNQCQNCDLSGANLERLNLSGANLQGVNLSSASLLGSNLSNANLEAANLQGASLSDSYLYRANLTGANFSNAILLNANLRETILIGTNFSRSDLRSVNLSKMDLSKAFFTGANLSKANLSGTIAVVLRPTDSQNSDNILFGIPEVESSPIAQMLCSDQTAFNMLDQSGNSTNGIDLSQTTPSYSLDPNPPSDTREVTTTTRLRFIPERSIDSTIVGANWSNVDLTDADLSNALLPKIDLTGAKLNRSNLKNICLIEAQIKNASFEEAYLTGARLAGVNLTDAKFTNARGLEVPRSIAQKPTETPPTDRLSLRLKESEAKQSVGALNRAQQAYHMENARFTTSIKSTDIDIKPDGADYRYRLFVAPDRYPAALQVALPKTPNLPTLLGFVYATELVYGTRQDRVIATIANLCISEKPGTPMPLWSAINYKNLKKEEPIACPSGFTPVK